ncbi:MAG TPA: hypothetical protein VKO18_20205 [Terriglobia bacterium]|nr:hypothetical protein [Terriglobia bacterium]
MNTNRKLRLVKFAVLAMLTACFGTHLAKAQTVQGKFDLPFEVQWGQAVLQPGSYSFTVNSGADSPANAVIVRGEDTASIIPSPMHDDSFSGTSALIIERRGERSTVRALRLVEAGLVLYYPAPKARGQVLAQAPKLIQRLPVLMAQK